MWGSVSRYPGWDGPLEKCFKGLWRRLKEDAVCEYIIGTAGTVKIVEQLSDANIGRKGCDTYSETRTNSQRL